MTESSLTRPTRRTLVKGAAWSVPVVVVAGGAPALASSPLPVTPDLAKAFGCKWPGGGQDCTDPLDKAFRIYIPFDNATGYSVQVNILGQAVTAGGTCSRDFQSWERSLGRIVPSDGSFAVEAGGETDYWVTWHDDNSGNNKTMSVTYTYTVLDGPDAGTVFGPYTVPVAKVFNQSCRGFPQPTILAGPCGQDCADGTLQSAEESVDESPVVEEGTDEVATPDLPSPDAAASTAGPDN